MGLSRRLRLDQLIWLVYSLLCREVLESTFHSRVLGVLTHFSKKYLLSFTERGSLHSRFFVDESIVVFSIKDYLALVEGLLLYDTLKPSVSQISDSETEHFIIQSLKLKQVS